MTPIKKSIFENVPLAGVPIKARAKIHVIIVVL